MDGVGTARTPAAVPAGQAVALPARAPGRTTHGRRGGVLLGETDLASAQRLTDEGSVLIDLRPRGEGARHPLPAAIHVSDAARWNAAVGAAHWALLYGGTTVQLNRLLRRLPGGQPALRVLSLSRR